MHHYIRRSASVRVSDVFLSLVKVTGQGHLICELTALITGAS